MPTRPTLLTLAAALGLSAAFALSGCDKATEAPAKPAPAAAGSGTPAKPADASAKPADDHGHDHADDEGHGPTTELGEQSLGGYAIKASRDGDIKAGSDAPIDVWITGGAKVAAVRFWIGTQDAKGSIKAKAEIEKDNWHTHAEVPNPLPEGSRLWVEIENDKGEKTLAGFDLKT